MSWLGWPLLILGFLFLYSVATPIDTWLREHRLGGWAALIIVAGVIATITYFSWRTKEEPPLLYAAPAGTTKEEHGQNMDYCQQGLPDDLDAWTNEHWETFYTCLEGRGYRFPDREGSK